jgi:hypothetical protein
MRRALIPLLAAPLLLTGCGHSHSHVVQHTTVVHHYHGGSPAQTTHVTRKKTVIRKRVVRRR